jgi:site-specific recombinase XerD
MVMLRNLTDRTLATYSSYLRNYLDYVSGLLLKQPEDVTWDDLRDYVIHLRWARKLSPRTINGHIAQLKFFYLYVLNKPWDSYQIPYLKFDKYVPEVLTQREVMEFIDSIEDLKQKAIISLMYSSGLRVSEVCKLEYKDISREIMTITIREAKNRVGSIAILSNNALKILTEYWMAYDKPKGWLFPGVRGDSHITPETVRNNIKRHLLNLGWSKKISSHCFRRAFGTHLFQNKVDIFTIKHLMRHKSLSSTAAYVYLSTSGVDSPISPFDTYTGKKP